MNFHNKLNYPYPPKEGDDSPWGSIQAVTNVGSGIYMVCCAGHGGTIVPEGLNDMIPACARRGSGYYEEDCEYSIPLFCLPKEIYTDSFVLLHIEEGGAEKTFQTWYWKEYEKITGHTLHKGQSFKKDREVFNCQ